MHHCNTNRSQAVRVICRRQFGCFSRAPLFICPLAPLFWLRLLSTSLHLLRPRPAALACVHSLNACVREPPCLDDSIVAKAEHCILVEWCVYVNRLCVSMRSKPSVHRKRVCFGRLDYSQHNLEAVLLCRRAARAGARGCSSGSGVAGAGTRTFQQMAQVDAGFWWVTYAMADMHGLVSTLLRTSLVCSPCYGMLDYKPCRSHLHAVLAANFSQPISVFACNIGHSLSNRPRF
jgi:hypothetical protein